MSKITSQIWCWMTLDSNSPQIFRDVKTPNTSMLELLYNYIDLNLHSCAGSTLFVKKKLSTKKICMACCYVTEYCRYECLFVTQETYLRCHEKCTENSAFNAPCLVPNLCIKSEPDHWIQSRVGLELEHSVCCIALFTSRVLKLELGSGL